MQDNVVLGDPSASQPRATARSQARKTWVWGRKQEEPSFCHAAVGWMQSGAGLTMSIQPVTQFFIKWVSGTFFWEIKDFGVQPSPRWWRLGGPVAPMVTVMLSRQKEKGHFSMAKIGKQIPERVSVCADSSRVPAREGLEEKNHHRMGELAVPVHTGYAA